MKLFAVKMLSWFVVAGIVAIVFLAMVANITITYIVTIQGNMRGGDYEDWIDATWGVRLTDLRFVAGRMMYILVVQDYCFKWVVAWALLEHHAPMLPSF